MSKDLAKLSLIHRHAPKGFIGIWWSFISDDWSSALVPGVIFMAGAAATVSLPLRELTLRYLLGSLYFLLYTLLFTITNQLFGEAEDRINKPYRILVNGDLTRQKAWGHALFVLVLFLGLGLLDGSVIFPALLWVGVVIIHNLLNWSRWWPIKHLCMGLGCVAQLSAAWLWISPSLSASVILAIGGLGIAITLSSGVQDLRDIAGDQATGRATLPIALGEWPGRIVITLTLLVLPLISTFILTQTFGTDLLVWIGDGLLSVIPFVLAARVLLLRSSHADHHTYLAYTGWYAGSLLIYTLLLFHQHHMF